jgi:hypothetical protein
MNNPNPMRYIVRDYCRKYPDDPGDEDIHDEDVVRPPNHKWATREEMRTVKFKSIVGFNTYGTCGVCWSSGPVFKTCIQCDNDKYQIVSHGKYDMDSQTIAILLNKRHEIAKANRTQNWTRTSTLRFHNKSLGIMLDNKYNYIEDDEERRKTVAKVYWDFWMNYAEITHTSF